MTRHGTRWLALRESNTYSCFRELPPLSNFSSLCFLDAMISRSTTGSDVENQGKKSLNQWLCQTLSACVGWLCRGLSLSSYVVSRRIILLLGRLKGPSYRCIVGLTWSQHVIADKENQYRYSFFVLVHEADCDTEHCPVNGVHLTMHAELIGARAPEAWSSWRKPRAAWIEWKLQVEY